MAQIEGCSPGMICPVCSGETVRLFKKCGIWICECRLCDHRFAELDITSDHVAAVYSDEYFFGGKDGYPDYLSEANLLTRCGEQYGKILSRYTTPGFALDVGCAAGYIAKGLQNFGWKVRGIEPNERMAKYARKQGMEVITGSLESFQTDECFDLITMIQVVPHFYNLFQALSVAQKITKPGGLWLIETWNRDSLTARLLKENWHEYNPPSVLHWFSLLGLERIMQRYGLDPIANGRRIKWLHSAHAKSIIRQKIGDSTFGRISRSILNGVPDQMGIPYLGDDLFWALFQKQR